MNENDTLIGQLKRQNQLLKSGLAIASGAVALLLLTAATEAQRHARFTEIDVERINVIGPNGKPDLVIANRDRLPAPITDGKVGKRSPEKAPGMIFYNAVGDENGGFIFDGQLDAQGKPRTGMHFSMDRFGGDQQLALGHYESNGFMESGLNIYDGGLTRDYGPLRDALDKAAPGPNRDILLKKWKDAGGNQPRRVFVGKTKGRSSALILAGADGTPRIMMTVTPEGTPALDFLDDKGRIVQHFPQAEASR